MRMIRAGVHFEFAEQRITQLRFGQHPADSGLQDPRWVGPQHLLSRGGLQPAGIARMAIVHLILQLLAREYHSLSIHNYHEIPGVQVRTEDRLMLPSQEHSHLGRQPPKYPSRRVDQVPPPIDVVDMRMNRLRHVSAFSSHDYGSRAITGY